MTAEDDAAPPRRAGHIPGEAGVWVLILGDLFVFSIFFVIIATTRTAHPAMFAGGQATLDRTIGLANTMLLLTSSLFVAMAVHRVRSGRPHAPRLFTAAIGCGLGFVALKAVEYGAKINAGLGVTTSDFYMLYFAFTGVHLAHVLIGLAVLAFLRSAARQPDSGRSSLVLIESGASFWHLVDMLWVVLFALFYLLR